MPSNDVEFLNQLCQQLYDDKTWERFRFCKLIRLCLSGHKNIDAIKNDAWAKLLRDAVNEMFCSRLFGEFRDEAFNLAGQMTLTFGNVDWIKCEATWNQNNSEFLILLLQLVSIEVRVVLPRLLEEKPPHWVNPEFGSTFILMEKLLLAFINNVNNDDEIALKTQDLLKINAAQIIRTIEEVRSTMIEVVAFIKAISLKTDPLSENFQNLLYAAIRILCVYMAEEPERMNPEICEVLKFILNTMKNSGHMFHINVIPIVKFFYCDDETMEHLQRGGINYDTIEEDFS